MHDESDVRKIIDSEINSLKAIDTENKYDEYYVIQVKDLLYITNINKENIFRFMTFYENITCENIENERVIFLQSVSPINDISPYYSATEEPCNIIVDYGVVEAPEKVNGVIYKISKNNQRLNLTLLKRGNVARDIRNNDKLWIKFKIAEEPN